MAFSLSALCHVALLSFHLSPLVHAQYAQDYIPQRIRNPSSSGYIDAYFYQPTQNEVPQQVVDLYPESVYIIYNCYYMKDICRNAYNFYRTPRGQITHPHSGLPTYIFGYDLNTGKGKKHSNERRKASCPTGGSKAWKDQHPCPEVDQRTIMRHDGAWFTTALEPNQNNGNLMNRRDSRGRVTELSKVRYSCDEFPPATWVEGGNGEDGDSEAQTRCAAIRCGNYQGVKAEQNWQATAHDRLRAQLVDRVNTRRTQYNQFPFYDPKNSVILFGFNMNNQADGIAARVWTYSDPAMSDVEEESRIRQGFARRSEDGMNDTWPERQGWPEEPPTYEELETLIKAGHGTEHLISANDSFVPWDDMGYMAMQQMLGMDDDNIDFRWDLEGDDDEEYDIDEPYFETSVEDNEKDLRIRRRERKRAASVRSTSDPSITPLLKRATAKDVAGARAIVADAISESGALNKARLARPDRSGNKRDVESPPPPPLLRITSEVAEAAALVAEADASETDGGAAVTRRQVAGGGTYWMGSITRKGSVPWGDDPDYAVFRNVVDFGAVGDGVTDDTAAIKRAMNSGSRCGEKCNGSTTKNAIVYFPPGTYLISSTVPLPFGTQVIGDANDRPKLVASSSFVGLGVLSTDEYTGGAGGTEQWFVNTANFYRQVRNVIIDVSRADDAQDSACLHYQVAQATSTQNVELVARRGSRQTGIFAENGSGGHISDVTFRGGGTGLYGGAQQFTAQRLTFEGCTTGVQVIWDWSWLWKSVNMTGVDVGFRLLADGDSGNIGSVTILDSSFSDVGDAAIVVAPPSHETASGSTGVVLEKVALDGVPVAVRDTAGATLLDASVDLVDQWALGPVYEGSADARRFSDGGKIGGFRRHSTLVDGDGKYFERARPQYDDADVGDFVHVKNLGAKGDGSTDDTDAFQAALYAAMGKILFVDAGSYILTSTITIPEGSKIVGETWSQLVASGSYFQDRNNPRVLIKVGEEGDSGKIEMQDLIFTSRGPTPGLIVVEWNIQAESAGSAGLWDCHVRLGGATGTELTPSQCPAVTSGVDEGCSAASLMFHLTTTGSGYFENMWLWGADHMIDDPDLDSGSNAMVQNSIYIARGMLIESTKPTWLYGTSSEHSVFYQYNFHRATNIFAGFLQTESPYFQPTPPPPEPFADVVGTFSGDPVYDCANGGGDFSGCDESWAVIIRESENIVIAGAGTYSWFSSYSQACIDEQQCQKALMLLQGNFANVRFYNLISIGAQYMAVMNGQGITAEANKNVPGHPEWSQVSVIDVSSDGSQFNELLWIDPKIWDMEVPQFTCSPPCNVKLPPWTGASSTIDYPLLTVSDGTWTSTVTKAPLTVSEWIFEAVTLTEDSSNGAKVKRQGLEPFYPVLATTPFWPPAIYTGPDGSKTTTAPTNPFPAPAVRTLSPDAPPPPGGSWPKRQLQPQVGQLEGPWVQECGYFDPLCIQQPWKWGENETSLDPGEPYNEDWEELLTVCPAPTSSSSSTTTTTSTTERPEPSPREGDPSQNDVSCYDSGESTDHVHMDKAANSFCNIVGDRNGATLGADFHYAQDFPFSYNGDFDRVTIHISLDVFSGCELEFNYDECRRYLGVPVDSCNCGGVDEKQGGVVENNCYSWRIDPNSSL